MGRDLWQELNDWEKDSKEAIHDLMDDIQERSGDLSIRVDEITGLGIAGDLLSEDNEIEQDGQ